MGYREHILKLMEIFEPDNPTYLFESEAMPVNDKIIAIIESYLQNENYLWDKASINSDLEIVIKLKPKFQAFDYWSTIPDQKSEFNPDD